MIRIGAGQGFSGDDLRGTREVVDDGVDYVCCEALAEFTLVSMHRTWQQDERSGYAPDLVPVAEAVLPSVAAGCTRLITSAGALNPMAARRALSEVATRMGVAGLRVGVVLGSELTGRIPELLARHSLRHLDTGEVLEQADGVEFASAYLGAFPIARALRDGAHVVITGRVADASLFMAPAIHEFGVSPEDWERLGRLAIVGHLLECSTQVTGGNFTGRWWDVPGLDAIGFPIAEVDDDGTAVITKPEGSGGRVNVDTVKEQLLYEVGDPARYLTPDVVVDLTRVRLEDMGGDRVRVWGGSGTPATDTYKLIMSRPAGWSAAVGITYTYPHALAKAKKAAEILQVRLEKAGVRPLETWVEYVGAGAMFGEAAAHDDTPEIVLRYAIRCATPEEVGALFRERLTALALGGPPGSAASGMGTSMPSPLSEIWPTLVPKASVDPHVRVIVEDL